MLIVNHDHQLLYCNAVAMFPVLCTGLWRCLSNKQHLCFPLSIICGVSFHSIDSGSFFSFSMPECINTFRKRLLGITASVCMWNELFWSLAHKWTVFWTRFSPPWHRICYMCHFCEPSEFLSGIIVLCHPAEVIAAMLLVMHSYWCQLCSLCKCLGDI